VAEGAVMTRYVDEFRTFILKGNVIDLAVALVLALAFAEVVTAAVEDLVTPLIAAIIGEPDFSTITFEINGSVFRIGDFINALITFLAIAAVIFFLVVKPMNALQGRSLDNTRSCPQCLSEIPKNASRCAFCTAEVSGFSAAA
jgi:large conductance mechanosensitive channel